MPIASDAQMQAYADTLVRPFVEVFRGAATVVAGPFYIDAKQAYVAGARASEAYRAGSQAAGSYVAGARAAEATPD